MYWDIFMNEFINLLAPHPLRYDRDLTPKELKTFGVIKKEYFVEQALQHLTHYVENYVDRIYFMDVLKKYDEIRRDRAKEEV